MNLGNRLLVPDSTAALLLDLDGVIIDSLALDLQLVPELVKDRWPKAAQFLTDCTIRRLYPLPVPDFWREISNELEVELVDDERHVLIELHDRARQSATYDVLPGIQDILAAAQRQGLKTCVVSNNDTSVTRAILRKLDFPNYWLEVVGLEDVAGVGKPDPAIYRKAAERCGARTEQCVSVEDSLVGLRSALGAGCFAVAVATGSDSFATLDGAGLAQTVYLSFKPTNVELVGDDPRRKSIATPNEFVTHMVEHILWRIGTGAIIDWSNNDWTSLGRELGAALVPHLGPESEASAVGMIDDGSCETLIKRDTPLLTLDAAHDVDLHWFLALACEQLTSGAPLLQVLEGLAEGTHLSMQITVCSAEDPHHTWEGIFRSVGMCLRALSGSSPTVELPLDPRGISDFADPAHSLKRDPLSDLYGWSFSNLTAAGGKVTRSTAESVCSLSLSTSGNPGCSARFETSNTIEIGEFEVLLDALAHSAGMCIEIEFKASVLSSSHVVTEDIGLALGKLLLQIAEVRWGSVGMSGAGSSVHREDDLRSLARVALSIEGRKFWKFVSLTTSFDRLRRGLLVGQTIGSTIRSEDLDDFIDGLSGGLGASVMVHVADFSDPTATWKNVFNGLGLALRQAFTPDTCRVGLPPGVKATLV